MLLQDDVQKVISHHRLRKSVLSKRRIFQRMILILVLSGSRPLRIFNCDNLISCNTCYSVQTLYLSQMPAKRLTATVMFNTTKSEKLSIKLKKKEEENEQSIITTLSITL